MGKGEKDTLSNSGEEDSDTLSISEGSVDESKELFYQQLTRSKGLRNLSILVCDDEEEKDLTNEKSSLFEFVQNVNRRISRTRENLTEKLSSDTTTSSNYDEHDERNEFQYETSDSLILPDNFFDDGNFELVDGLIVLIEKKKKKKPVPIKLYFKNNIVLPKRGSQCNDERKEIKPRAA